jgi:energy-coupling factor transporter transmembrane protein EcfT
MAIATNRESKGKIILIVVGIIILVIAFVFFFFGARSILKFLLYVGEFIMFLGILFGLAYLFYIAFIKKQKFDVNYVNKMKLVDAFTRIKRPLLKDLYLTGDKGHSRALVGAIKGYGRVQIPIRNYLYTEEKDPETGKILKKPFTKPNDRGDQVHQYEIDKMEQDVFICKTKGMAGMFQEPMVIRVHPLDHDDLVGDVNLVGFSLIPISEYWFLNSDHLDIRKIDFAILREAERTIAFTTLSDMKQLIDLSTGIDSQHKKGIESKSLVEVPEMQKVGQQGTYNY